MEIKYRTTKEECQFSIDKKMPIVCRYCGGKIEPIETEDNSGNPTFWQGCNNCMRFDNGTTPKIYEMAVNMVDENHLYVYTHNKRPDKENNPNDFKCWRNTQISGAVDVVTQVLNLAK